MLMGDPAYKFIHVEDFGYVVSYAPRTSFGDFQTMLPVSVLFSSCKTVVERVRISVNTRQILIGS